MNLEIHKQISLLESSLNYVLQHLQDSDEVGPGSFEERKDEVRRHVRDAKRAFNWIDNNTTITQTA